MKSPFQLKFCLAGAVLMMVVSARLEAVPISSAGLPGSLAGTWRIARLLSAPMAACWDDAHLKALVGSTLRYQTGAMVWQGGRVAVPEALSRTLSRQQFEQEYKLDPASLGVHAEEITEVDLQHEDADVTGATTEVPGDTVVLAGPGRILVSACGAFYEAVRPGAKGAR